MLRLGLPLLLAAVLAACAPVKPVVKDARAGTRQAGQAIKQGTRELGHAVRDAAREIGHASRDTARDLKEKAKAPEKK